MCHGFLHLNKYTCPIWHSFGGGWIGKRQGFIRRWCCLFCFIRSSSTRHRLITVKESQRINLRSFIVLSIFCEGWTTQGVRTWWGRQKMRQRCPESDGNWFLSQIIYEVFLPARPWGLFWYVGYLTKEKENIFIGKVTIEPNPTGKRMYVEKCLLQVGKPF